MLVMQHLEKQRRTDIVALFTCSVCDCGAPWSSLGVPSWDYICAKTDDLMNR